MLRKQKGKIAVIAAIQLAIIATSLLFYHRLTLLYYINISFYYSFVLLLMSLLLFVTRTGFFDIIGKSFTIAFSRNDEHRKFRDITPLSELVAFEHNPLVFHGAVSGFVMLIALAFYYI